MEEIHKLGCAHFQNEDEFFNPGDQDIVENIRKNTNNKAPYSRDHSLVDPIREQGYINIIAGH